MIFVLRTTAGREKQVVDKIIAIAKKHDNIYSVLSPAEVRGYVFVEADNRSDVQQAVYGVPHVKGVIEGNGLNVALVRIGRKLLIDEEKFFQWINEQQEGR